MLGMVSYWVDHGWRSSGMFWEGTSIYYSHQRFSYAPELVLRFEPRTTSRTESRNLPWKNPWPTCDLVGWLTPKKRKRGDVCFHIYVCMYVSRIVNILYMRVSILVIISHHTIPGLYGCKIPHSAIGGSEVKTVTRAWRSGSNWTACGLEGPNHGVFVGQYTLNAPFTSVYHGALFWCAFPRVHTVRGSLRELA